MDRKASKAKTELKQILDIKEEDACVEALADFCQRHSDKLPLPGENSQFDDLMWKVSEYVQLGKEDKAVVKRVTERLISGLAQSGVDVALKFRELIGTGKEMALSVWQEALHSLSWQQLQPVAITRSAGKQIVSLGTIERQLGDAHVELNLGWLVDDDSLRILMQARDEKSSGLQDLELRVKEMNRGVVFIERTDSDGSLVASSVEVGPGSYRIEIGWKDLVAVTPYFVITAS
ncbi:MAG: hypothetical protein K2X29_03180 [Candidatus Obscuribacterales bacterium]|nr:hypothetical protein [Candidatus Obscuribacterales bacterium]